VYNKWGIPPLVDPVRAAMPASWRQNYTKAHATALEWRGKTYQEVLDSYFTDPDIKRILCGLLGYIGAKASKNSAATVVENTFGYFFFGSYHPIGGSQRFANALASYISENNGTVLFGSSVDEITVLDNAVTGVKVGSTSFSAPVVVSNVNAKTLYLDLVDKDFLPKGFVQYIQNLPMGASIFAVHAGVHADLSQYPAIIQDRDQHIYFVIGSHNDPTVAPQNSATIAISETARFQDFANKPSFEYQHYVKNRARDLLEKAKKRLPEIQGHIVVQDSMTPITFQDLVNMPEGAIYGFDQSRVSVRPYFKSPISGLYLSNASSSGGGVEAVVINGILCKHDIEQWKK
jgi:all-trans-retinol 13,14-reductase